MLTLGVFHILLLFIILPPLVGVNNSGQRSHTRYDCHHATAPHDALIHSHFPTAATPLIATLPIHHITALLALLTLSMIFVTHANFAEIYHTALSIHHTIVVYT
jgi:hypothetical protein